MLLLPSAITHMQKRRETLALHWSLVTATASSDLAESTIQLSIHHIKNIKHIGSYAIFYSVTLPILEEAIFLFSKVNFNN